MTPRQHAEMERLKRRCQLLEARNRELGQALRPDKPRRAAKLPKLPQCPKGGLSFLHWVSGCAPGDVACFSASDVRQVRSLLRWIDRLSVNGTTEQT